MIEIQDISFSYDHASRTILEHVGFCVQPGECLAILGNNGAGKSTLLKCINRIIKAQDGKVFIHDKNMFELSRREMAQHIAYVPQRTETPRMMVFDAVLLGRKPYIKWDISENDKAIATDLLEKFGLSDFKARYLNELSGGEVQKVILARAMAQQPEFLLLDEPTSNLDPKNQHMMLGIVQKLAREHQMGVAIVIHDLNLALKYCDKFLFLKDGRAYAHGGIESVTPEIIENVYGLKADIIDYRGTKLVVTQEMEA